jgi:DNA-binding transcriptional LysR family regulator
MAIDTIEIRLLQVFDAVYKTRSVTEAAVMLDLGQPAVSVALSKLRHHFGDPLFVRTSGGMEPTPFGEGLVRPVRGVLEALDVVMGQQNSFDPATSQRLFRICMTDISQLVLLPKLWNALRVAAPGIRIDILPLTSDIARQLESGEADLALGLMPQLEAGFYQNVLFAQKFACMVSAHHPRIQQELRLDQFASESHAVVSSSGAAPLFLDQEIERLGIKRRISLNIPNFIGAALVVEHTDLILTIPERLAEVLQGRASVRMFAVPLHLPQYDVKQHWHERFHNDPGSQWLRRMVADLMSTNAQPAVRA